MIDLYSDTKTRPSPGMLAAMMNAETGDSQAGEDPTVNALCERVADLLGKPAAIFLPSGTMCNQIAIRIHATAGSEIICHESAHVIHSEAGGIAGLTGSNIRTLGGGRGQFSASDVVAAVRTPSQYAPRTAAVVIEQTSNFGGGAVWPLELVRQVGAVSRSKGIALHIDGARLMNAVVASGVSAADFSACADSVWIDFTKALGAPLGAVLAGSQAFIEEAKYWRQMFGGALRQAGICAAGCLYSLDNNVERLAEDHANASLFHSRISSMAAFNADDPPETNIVLFSQRTPALSPQHIIAAVAQAGVRIGFMGAVGKLRAIPHLGTPREDVIRAADIIERVTDGLLKTGEMRCDVA